MSDIPVRDRRCTVCRREPAGRAWLSLHGELTCQTHPVLGRCVFCSRSHPIAHPPGWCPFGRRLRCPACVAGSVDTQNDVRRELPSTRAELGVVPGERVRVLRASPDPVYGGGFRLVHAAATRYGVGPVLDTVLRSGCV